MENYQQDASNFLTENDFNSGYFDIFKTRVAKTQNIILLILLFLIVIYFIVALGLKFLSLIELHIFRILLWKPLKNLFAACCKKFSHKGYFSIKNKLGKMNYFKGFHIFFDRFNKMKKNQSDDKRTAKERKNLD